MKEAYKVIELSTGGEVKCKPVPALLVMRFQTENPSPTVPKKTRELDIKDGEGKPHTEEYEDPNDPEYRKALEEWVAQRGDKLNDIYLMLGTEVEVPDDEEWLVPLRTLGVLPKEPENEHERKLFYLRYWLVRDINDLFKIIDTVAELTWPSEEEVEAAEASFPG